MMSSAADEQFMACALEQAREARFSARPNPAVGCVLVRDGQIIGRGFTHPVGGPHAEIAALRDAGDASGATAYVTLEPCSHHGRTPPCADALVQAGISRVVIALEDPNPLVSGGGIARLQQAGIAVAVGVCAGEAEQQLQGFLWRMRRGRGRVRLKVAASLDGRSATASGESQWITGEAARADVQLLRAESCAIVTGIGTLLADDCRLTVRAEQLPLTGPLAERALQVPPLRVVLDSRGRAPAAAALFTAAPNTVQLVSDGLTPRPEGAVAVASGQHGGLELSAVLSWLNQQACNEILFEAGPTLAGAMLNSGLVDELVLYMAPCLLGSDGRPFARLFRQRLGDSVKLKYRSVTCLGDDLRIIAIPE